MYRNTALGLYSTFVLLSVFFLIFAGASVTSNQAGLAVPDWPMTFGENPITYPLSKWQGGIFYEHGHRIVATIVGALTVILALWIWFVESRRWVRVLAVLSVVAVILQGLLGGLTVLLRLPLIVSAMHGVLGQSYMCIILMIAFSQLRECRIGEVALAASYKKLFWSVLILTGAIFLQLVWGALMRHSESGLAVPDFPTSGGTLIPSFDQRMLDSINGVLKSMGMDLVTMSQVAIHLVHRFFALVVLALAITTYSLFRQAKSLPSLVIRHGFYLALMLVMQVFLGIMVVFSLKFHVITSLHVVIGAFILALSVTLLLRLLSLPEPAKQQC
jgi:cytochrome c oxidase assembly protein subunit 15